MNNPMFDPTTSVLDAYPTRASLRRAQSGAADPTTPKPEEVETAPIETIEQVETNLDERTNDAPSTVTFSRDEVSDATRPRPSSTALREPVRPLTSEQEDHPAVLDEGGHPPLDDRDPGRRVTELEVEVMEHLRQERRVPGLGETDFDRGIHSPFRLQAVA